MKKLILLLSFTFVFIFTMQAQVTVGLDKKPVDAALLEVKSQEANNPVSVTDISNITSSTGGLGLPRVWLESLTTLQPFIALTDPQWVNAGTTKIKEMHAGLLVYNLNTTAPFTLGIYVWDGSKWFLTTGNAENGIRQDNGTFKLGGMLTESTSIDMNGNDLSIATGASKMMKVEGNLSASNMYITETPSTSGSTRALTRNVNTGQLEMAAAIPPKLAFMQSSTTTNVTNAQMQNGVVVPWDGRPIAEGGDEVTNNDLVEFIDAQNAFALKEDAMIEVSAYVCYIGGGLNYNPTQTPIEIVVNATIQLKRKEKLNPGDPEPDWEDYASVRGVYPNSMSHYINTLNVPPVMMSVKQGDMVRLIILRPPNEGTGSGYLGENHIDGKARIVKPYGTKFSKGLKIIVQ